MGKSLRHSRLSLVVAMILVALGGLWLAREAPAASGVAVFAQDSDTVVVEIVPDGGANAYKVRFAPDNSLIVSDKTLGAVIESGTVERGVCVQPEPAKLRCPGEFTEAVVVIRGPEGEALGPGDSLDGGPPRCDGDDRVRIDGGGLLGRGTTAKPLVVWGSPGPDYLNANGFSVLHGCAGADTLEIEKGKAFGEIGPDVLVDGPGRSGLFGGFGNDVIGDGRFGETLLDGYVDSEALGEGRDLLRGGPGADLIFAGFEAQETPRGLTVRPLARDRVRCGSGLDRTYIGRRSRARSCEEVTRFSLFSRGS